MYAVELVEQTADLPAVRTTGSLAQAALARASKGSPVVPSLPRPSRSGIGRQCG